MLLGEQIDTKERSWNERSEDQRRLFPDPREGGDLGNDGQGLAPVWLTVVAWLYLSVCFCCAGIIAFDIAFNHRRQLMGVMNFVFPITALYFGPFALGLYWRWGRAAAQTTTPMSMSRAAVSGTAVASAGAGMQ